MPSSFIRITFLLQLLIFFSVFLFPAAFLYANKAAEQKKISAPAFKAETHTALVRHVVDGDSLYLLGTQRQIRLWGVDAPERGEDGYHAARKALTKKVKGKRLRCVTKDNDRYGRIVGHCFLAANNHAPAVDINEWMIKGGTAKEYCYFTKGFFGYCR